MRPRKLRITQTRPVRRVVYFNPEVFVTKRLNERKKQRRLDAFLSELNARLRSPRSRRDEHAGRFAVMQRLSQQSALRLFDIALTQHRHEGTEKPYYQVALTRDLAEWQRRRRYHGFVLLVAHPDKSVVVNLVDTGIPERTGQDPEGASTTCMPAEHGSNARVRQGGCAVIFRTK